ncbi:MAG: hypothetical protein OXR73_29305 [Myxococcales bacterium]|nr:hypothetical protein [Myxococcales bacterium]
MHEMSAVNFLLLAVSGWVDRRQLATIEIRNPFTGLLLRWFEGLRLGTHPVTPSTPGPAAAVIPRRGRAGGEPTR